MKNHLIVPGRRNLDLTKDVVKTPIDIHGSTYLVDESWASRVVFDAIVRGPTFSVSLNLK